jgi:hypothetical protein
MGSDPRCHPCDAGSPSGPGLLLGIGIAPQTTLQLAEASGRAAVSVSELSDIWPALTAARGHKSALIVLPPPSPNL